MDKRFPLDLSLEEGILLLTGARLLDRLIVVISYQTPGKEELVSDVISKIAGLMPAGLSELSEEIADTIVSGIEAMGKDEARTEQERYHSINNEEENGCNYPMYPVERILPPLKKALNNRVSVRVEYYSFAREAIDVFTLNPLSISNENGIWKMAAFCKEIDGIMVFRVDRIKKLAQTTSVFAVPKDFKPGKQEIPFAS